MRCYVTVVEAVGIVKVHVLGRGCMARAAFTGDWVAGSAPTQPPGMERTKPTLCCQQQADEHNQQAPTFQAMALQGPCSTTPPTPPLTNSQEHTRAQSDPNTYPWPCRDLERKHAQDRELWKRDSAAAVKAAREEMMALTDNRLEITTKRAVLENEQMSGELQYQSRQVGRGFSLYAAAVPEGQGGPGVAGAAAVAIVPKPPGGGQLQYHWQTS